MLEAFSSLFKHAKFYALKKNASLNASEEFELKRLNIAESISKAHPDRIREFTLGRLCAHMAAKNLLNEDLLSLEVENSRSPKWPKDIVGSISHNKEWVGACVATSKNLLGVGIDFEDFGRVKKELGRMIEVPEDLKNYPGLTDEELLTIIFSAKESLFKAIYPRVQKFFGFDHAALKTLNLANETFEIELIKELKDSDGRNYKGIYAGKIKIVDSTCLTVIEYEK